MNDSLNGKNSGKLRVKKNFMIQAWLVLFLSVFFGVSLAAVQLTLSPKIKANKLNETMKNVPGLLPGHYAPDALKISRRFLTAVSGGVKKSYSLFTAMSGKTLVGYVVKASGQGYSDSIDALIGLDASLSRITGVFILSQKETPGLGGKITDPEWRAQFIDKPTDRPLKVVKTGARASNEIDAITGATISSRSLCSIINQAVSDVKGILESNEKSSQQVTGVNENG